MCQDTECAHIGDAETLYIRGGRLHIIEEELAAAKKRNDQPRTAELEAELAEAQAALDESMQEHWRLQRELAKRFEEHPEELEKIINTNQKPDVRHFF